MTINSLNDLSAAWGSLFWNASWQGGTALLLVLIAIRAVRRIPASAQCWLWRLAFLKLVIAGIAIAPIPLRWLPPETAEPANVAPTDPAAQWLSTPQITDQPSPGPHNLAVAVPMDSKIPSAAATPVATSSASARISGWSCLFIAWIAGVAAGLVHLVRQWAVVRTMVSNLAVVTDDRVHRCVIEGCRRMNLTRRPELLVSNDAGGVCLIGIVRPVIVLPTAILKICTPEALHAAILHELAHIKRRDLLWNWLPALAEVLYFFHPLVWLARRDWRIAQEIATDELAVSVAQVDGAQYAGLLVELVAKCRTTTIRTHLAVGVSETYSQLSRRMSAMLTFQESTRRRRVVTGIVLGAIALCGLVPWKLTAREAAAQAEGDGARSVPSPLAPATHASGPRGTQEAVIAEIEKLGGEVIYDENRPGRPAISVSLFKSQVTDDGLKHLGVLTGLRALTLDGTNVGDAGLMHLKELTGLQALDINVTKVTDEGLRHLKLLTRLEQLGLISTRVTDKGLAELAEMTAMHMLLLSQTKVTDNGLKHLQKMTRLQTLLLDGTRISDAGLEQVGALTSLRDLRLNDTRIGDAGLVHLKGMTSLRTLVLNSTRITDGGLESLTGLTELRTLTLEDNSGLTAEGVQKLEAALPNCKVSWSRSSPAPEQNGELAARKSPPVPTAPEKSVEGLIDEFTNAEFAWQQGEVAQKLIARKDKGIIPKIEQHLDSEDRGRRCNAAFVLAGLEDKRGLPILIRELEDKEARPTERIRSDGRPDQEGQVTQDRYYAALLLGRLGKREAVPALIEATYDKSINYRAAISLGEIGDRSAAPALRLMAKDFPDERLWAGHGLAALGESEGFEILTQSALTDPQSTNRRHAVEALGKFGNPQTTPTLKQALQDVDEQVRAAAAKALDAIRDKEIKQGGDAGGKSEQ